MNHRNVFVACDSAFHGPRLSLPARPKGFFLLVAAGAVLLAAVGCSDKVEIPKIPAEEQNILFILRGYCKFNGSYQRTPKTLDELKPMLKEFGDPEKIILSPRDGQPYVLVGGIDISRMSSGGEMPVIAYESKGADGKRQVVDLRGKIRLLTPAEFDQLKFPPTHKPQK